MDDRRHGSSRINRINRIVNFGLTIGSASLSAYWLLKWFRGDTDEYRNQIVGGLTLTSAMTLLTSAQLVRGARTRWALLGAGAILLVIDMVMIVSHGPISLLTVVALLLILGSIARAAHALWPPRGIGLTEWKTMPVTLDRRRALCSALAVLSLGAALFSISLFGVPREPWQATVVVSVTTLMFVGVAVLFFVVRARLRGR